MKKIFSVTCKSGVTGEGGDINPCPSDTTRINKNVAQKRDVAIHIRIAAIYNTRAMCHGPSRNTGGLPKWQFQEKTVGDMASTRKIISGIETGSQIGIFIGPEGGFDVTEVTRASEKGFIPITLGRRILRTETAAMTVMGWLVYLFDDKA